VAGRESNALMSGLLKIATKREVGGGKEIGKSPKKNIFFWSMGLFLTGRSPVGGRGPHRGKKKRLLTYFREKGSFRGGYLRARKRE